MKYAQAPALDLSRADHRVMEAHGVVENIMGSMIGSVRKELEDRAKFEKGKNKKPPRAPTAEGYTKLLLADLRARGFDIVEVSK